MKCQKCGSENPKLRKFCRECGAGLSQVCPKCGFENLPEDKYCGECGQDLLEEPKPEITEPIIEGERKQVTVLFSDLSGYTAMTEKLDPEEVREIMSKIFGETAQIVAKYEGHIDKFIGDAVMVIFGVPKVHEDDPVRAIKAAVEVHDLVEGMNPNLEKRIGKPLLMHSGISTGLVVTGETDLKKGTEKVLGNTINMASRLTSLATEDEIFVDEETYKQAERYVDFEVLGPAKVKGKTEPIQLYEVISIRERPTTTVHRLSGLRAELIGRKTEFSQLEEAVEQLKKSKATIVAILGEAGTGKSRLIEEFKATLDLEELRWVKGHCYAYAQNIPYFPLINLMNQAWQIEESDPPEKVKEKVESNIERLLGKTEHIAPYIGSLYGLKYPEMEGVDPEFWKTRLFTGVRAILAALTETRPTIVFLEDLQWADPSSIDLLRFTLLETRYPALLLCTYRPPFSLFTSHRLSGIETSYQEIRLEDLSPSEAQDMMESLLKTKDIPHELKKFVQEKAEGNPFYLEELVNSLIESEILARDNGKWELTRPIGEFEIPLTINGVISARIDRLEKKMKRILQEASVIGRVFPYEILKKITELKNQIEQSLRDLERLDLVRTWSFEPDLEYVFKHALTQDVAYNGLLKRERRKIHERIAYVMEQFFQDRLSEFYETLAFHFKQGKSVHKAVEYLTKSGEKSLERYAVEESHQYFQDAFDLLAKEPPTTKEEREQLIDLIINWALVFYYSGDFKKLENLLTSHKSLAESLGDKERLGMFYMWLGMTLWSREKFRDAYKYEHKALKLGEQTENQQVISYACTWLTFISVELGFPDEAIAHAERVKQLSSSYEFDYHPYFQGLGGKGYAHYSRGDVKRTYEAGKELLEFGQKHSNIRSIVMGQWIIGLSHLIAGDFSSAVECHNRALQVSADPFYSQFPRLFLGIGYLFNGQIQKAEGLLQEVLAYAQNFGGEVIGTPAQVFLGIVSAAQGHPRQGVKMIKNPQKSFLKNQNRWRYVWSEYLLGELYLGVVEGASPISLSLIAKNIGFLVKDFPLAGKKAEEHFSKAIEAAKEMGAKGILGQANLGLGLLHRAKGKKAQAREYIVRSVQYFEQCEAETYLNQAKDALASLK